MCMRFLLFLPIISIHLYLPISKNKLNEINESEGANFTTWGKCKEEDVYTLHVFTLSVCLSSVSNSKPRSPAERRECPSKEDSPVWSPDLSGSRVISVWTRILNAHVKSEPTEGLASVPERVKIFLAVMKSLMQPYGSSFTLGNWKWYQLNSNVSVTCSSVYTAVVFYFSHTWKTVWAHP